MLENRVGQAKVALGVLEVDGIDLVGHGGGADFAGHGFLLEVAQGNITPYVPVEIHEYGVETGEAIEQLGHVIVGFYLGGVGVPLQSQGGDKLLGIGLPVDVRVGAEVSIVVAHRAIDLAEVLHALKLAHLPLQARDDVGYFLAHGGGAGGLAVGARQHRGGGALVGERDQGVDNLAHRRQQDFLHAVAQHQRVGEVVDVFRSAGEMHELAYGPEFLMVGKTLLDEILHRLDVVIGGGLDILDAARVRLAEVGGDGVQSPGRRGRQGGYFGNALVGRQALQPAHLHQHPAFDQAEFAEDTPQGRRLAAVAAVDGRYRAQG